MRNRADPSEKPHEEQGPEGLRDQKIALFDDRISLVYSSTVVYLVMAATGAGIAHFAYGTLMNSLSFEPTTQWRLIMMGGMSGLVLLISSYLAESWLPGFAELKKHLASMFSHLPWYSMIYLAFLSAVSEELLFRAALQPYLGIVVTSVVFALLHGGPQTLISVWSVWAFLASLLLGMIYERTDHLLPCIIAHFMVNAVGFLSMKKVRRDILH